MSGRHTRRFDRQLAALTRRFPQLGRFAAILQGRPWVLVRLPLGLLLIGGGFLAILPVFGLWMIPLGLVILAIDLPVLRPFVSNIIIRLRRKWAVWQHKGR
ncbi:tryptophan synthase subunit beta [Pseudotabrizicola algicola]|uniref:Tryptophan synthase subunit beta n=1 Tax=Pseudotabrizicola algicola TaxID=2709381 RepID=A0A6B3RNX8_9RHOB|nr:tryptophan synthase subunit beta [Pseudotabrizicola algicola]NEX46548.1 tryptophan synthase subunit beta [Pseudotabrizicola algicola]